MHCAHSSAVMCTLRCNSSRVGFTRKTFAPLPAGSCQQGGCHFARGKGVGRCFAGICLPGNVYCRWPQQAPAGKGVLVDGTLPAEHGKEFQQWGVLIRKEQRQITPAQLRPPDKEHGHARGEAQAAVLVRSSASNWQPKVFASPE